MRRAVLFVSAMLTLAAPAAALAQGSARGTVRLQATVPASCWVRPDGAVRADALGAASLRVTEACNSGGFRVMAYYRPLAADERASLRYGEALISLPRHGEALLRQSMRAEKREREFRFEETQLNEPLVIALAIAPM